MITTLPECMIDSQSLKSSPAVPPPFLQKIVEDSEVAGPSLLQAQQNK